MRKLHVASESRPHGEVRQHLSSIPPSPTVRSTARSWAPRGLSSPRKHITANLDLVLAALARGRGSLEQLDDRGRVLLQLLQGILRFLELRLQVLEELVVRVVGFLELILHGLQLGGALRRVHVDVS